PLPNPEVFIHQPLRGAQGQPTQIQIPPNHILKTPPKLNQILPQPTPQSIQKIHQHTHPHNFLSPQQPKHYPLLH
ncbi:ATP-dependent Clp protease proteolytic subunit, partial [Staphylococcus saprophyticus]|uniref:ATP-dependent Clp protease proteolytic subunit n=1 Tax=Staphylococcus saprophyticus TaxID=29385 RepID=UPI001642C8CC